MKKLLFNEGWEFTLLDTMENCKMDGGLSLWRPVSLPHDWSVEYEYEKNNMTGAQCGYLKSGIGWYRRFLKCSKEELKQKISLFFEGVYHNSTIYVNGVVYEGRDYGYLGFALDITESLQVGLNCIAVRVDCSKEPSSRWYNGCGIFRNVWLSYIGALQIEKEQVAITTKMENETLWCANVSFEIIKNFDVFNEEKVKEKLNIALIQDGNCIDEQKVALQGEGSWQDNISFRVKNPKLWELNKPNLYHCVFMYGIEELQTITFGFRNIEFIPNKGMFLNGQQMNLKGVCLHHDAGSLGAAVPRELWKKRILMLKEMGCNAIRTAHNPFEPAFYELCDENSMMVVDECFDGWNINKAEFDYGLQWEKNYKQDLRDFILRNRNHPSIVMWGIGNEVLQISAELTKELMEIVHTYDDTRKITCGVNGIGQAQDSVRAILDIAGYNDGGGGCFIYAEDHEKRPEQLLVATEAPHTLQTRGFYRTQTWWRDKNQPRIEIPNLTEEEIFFDQNINYSSSYDNCGVRTCARDSWGLVEKYPYLCGEFRWTGFDYLGEVFKNMFPMRMGNFGIIDTANFPKDHYYLYQSMWSEKPMIHMLPHWTHHNMKPGTKIPVWVYTNCEMVELFLNGKSLGKKEKGDAKQLEWIVPYEAGELKVVGVSKDGEILEQSRNTSYTPSDILIEWENLSDTMLILNMNIADDKGSIIPNANMATGVYTRRCSVKGADNGAPDDMTHMKWNRRKTFNGSCMYFIEHDNGQREDINLLIGAILGDSYFKEETTITILAKNFLGTSDIESNCSIYFTLDGTMPSKESDKYTDPIAINETVYCRAAFVNDETDEVVLSLEQMMIKGEKSPVIDIEHLNYDLELEVPTGPYAPEVCGQFMAENSLYVFQESGELIRKTGSVEENIGYWWYDFPADRLENPDYAGEGEIWFTSGEKNKIMFTTQQGRELLMENENKAISTAYNAKAQVQFKKI
ncbi:MAG: glycoside hydrolase family 2 TIM barrel-domain containing protein [Eubacteriales bacterium]